MPKAASAVPYQAVCRWTATAGSLAMATSPGTKEGVGYLFFNGSFQFLPCFLDPKHPYNSY